MKKLIEFDIDLFEVVVALAIIIVVTIVGFGLVDAFQSSEANFKRCEELSGVYVNKLCLNPDAIIFGEEK